MEMGWAMRDFCTPRGVDEVRFTLKSLGWTKIPRDYMLGLEHKVRPNKYQETH
jgi:hypothetical protein